MILQLIGRSHKLPLKYQQIFRGWSLLQTKCIKAMITSFEKLIRLEEYIQYQFGEKVSFSVSSGNCNAVLTCSFQGFLKVEKQKAREEEKSQKKQAKEALPVCAKSQSITE